MKKFLLSIVILLGTSVAALAWQQNKPLDPVACAAMVPYGQPAVVKPDATLLCRMGYFTLHDNQAKLPIWTAWTVSPKTVNGCWPRTNAFDKDDALGKSSAEPDDYAGTGYDKGHVANDAHQSWDQMVEYESFLMSNMMPQLPGLNRGIWKLLEAATGSWAFDRKHTILVYAGPIYKVNDGKTIGEDKVDVPDAFYKIVIDEDTKEVLAFLFPHKEDQGNDLTVVQSTVAEVEAATGIEFYVPAGTDKHAKAALWPINFKNVAEDKKKVCKK